jgi:hypothetical protein
MLVADATQRHRAASVEPEQAYNCPTNAIKKWRASIPPCGRDCPTRQLGYEFDRSCLM